RSRFFRAINRRFNAADFWLEQPPSFCRERWFNTVEAGHPQSNSFAELDISSSQTQILAVFLGLPKLEVLAGAPDFKFKNYLAAQLWALHEREHVLADGPNGYKGADDPRLVAFVKEHWMRWNYGGKVGMIVHELARDPAEYGPGWDAKVFET